MPDEAQTLVETAGDIMQGEIDSAQATTAAVIEAAGAAIDQAQEHAQEIAEAAMQTEIGRRVGAVEQGVSEWLGQLEGLRQELSLLRSEVSRLSEATAATATLVVSTELQSADPSLSIQPPSSNPPTTVEPDPAILEVVPGSLENVVASPAAPIAPVVRKHRFL